MAKRIQTGPKTRYIVRFNVGSDPILYASQQPAYSVREAKKAFLARPDYEGERVVRVEIFRPQYSA